LLFKRKHEKINVFLLIAFRLKPNSMKNIILTLLIISSIVFVTCKKDEVSERFTYLTGATWIADSLLADGVKAGGVGEILEDFNGEVVFNPDGTGVFGVYTGTWQFAYNDTQLMLTTDSLDFPILTQIAELTQNSLKITTGFPNPLNSGAMLKIRMTFKSK
jgi:hypothetical protein